MGTTQRALPKQIHQNCIELRLKKTTARQDGEMIKSHFHRIKSSVDREWLESIDETVRADAAAQVEGRNIQTRQRSQNDIGFSIEGLRTLALKQKKLVNT